MPPIARSVSLRADASGPTRPISPLIYGLAYASADELRDLRATLNRQGGNPTSRYNWLGNIDNRAADWYFESLPYPPDEPGHHADEFVAATRDGGAEPMLTIPTVGWVAQAGPGRGKLSSFSVAKYGPQTSTDAAGFPDAGNGVRRLTGRPITNNDPNDASRPAGPEFQQGWVAHLVSRWGPAATGGLKFYLLDNEPGLWHESHRDVHPDGAGMEEVRDKILAYSAMIHTVDSDALVLGPEEWNWWGLLNSGLDKQRSIRKPDRAAHGGQDYLPWLLGELRRQTPPGGRRPLDMVTVHYYPQGEVFSDDVSEARQRHRNRSTRALWDPTYRDESWVGTPIALLPVLRRWVEERYFADCPIGLTEYNWGAEGHMNGATAQADVLGIFGREGLDLAARWTTPPAGSPVYLAFRLYRNYDGEGGAFGDQSIPVAGGNPDELTAYAATRSGDGALTVMLIHKEFDGDAEVSLSLGGIGAGRQMDRYELSGANRIEYQAAGAFDGFPLNLRLPARSVTLLVVRP